MRYIPKLSKLLKFPKLPTTIRAQICRQKVVVATLGYKNSEG